jgi:8-amino-7-oxononanoate synthase
MNGSTEPQLVSGFRDANDFGKDGTSATETILSALQSHVALKPNAIAYTFLQSDNERQTRTYQQLDIRARQIACGLLQSAQPGDRALMAYPAGLEFIEAFLGCLYAGLVAVPAYPPKKNRNSDRVLAIANDCKPRLLLCGRETRSSLDGDFADKITGSSVIATDELEESTNGPLPTLAADDLAFLQYTSGSTAAPKGVIVSHGNMVANEQLIERSFGFSAQSVVVSWLPMFHDMGLIGGILAPLFVGFPSVLMAPNVFLREPVKWLQAVTEFGATTTGAPNFAYELCVKKITTEQKASLDLSTLQVAYNGAEPVRAETLRSFSRTFRDCGFKEAAFFPCYGMAETTLLVSGGPPMVDTPILRIDSELLENHQVLEISSGQEGQDIVGCGQLRPEMQVRVVHPETGQECCSDEVGEIWVHGASVAQGYFNLAEETAQTFRARIHGDDRSWLRTGDFGFVVKNELFVTGRLKDLMIVRGRNIYPQDIERLTERYLSFVEPNAAAAFSIESEASVRLVLVVEGTREMVRWSRNVSTDEPELAQLRLSINAFRQALAEELEIVLDQIVFVRPTTFPRTSSGKVQRRQCQKLYLTNQLETVLEGMLGMTTPGVLIPSPDCSPPSEMNGHGRTASNVEHAIIESLREWAKSEQRSLPALTNQTNFSSLGIDSLAAADIALRIERRTGTSVDPDSMYLQPTIGELTNVLKRSQRHASPQSRLQPPSPLSRRDYLDHFAQQTRRFSDLRAEGFDFFSTPISTQHGTHVEVDGRRMLMMASYSYLGLINHPEVNAAAIQAIAACGTGAHGVRLLAGTLSEHRQLERELAQFMEADDAIVFNSGFITNVATVSALVGAGDLVIGDEYNHASIHDGCMASKATFRTFRHNRVDELEMLLRQHSGTRILVVIDAVYSMEGDIAPMPEIVRLCKAYGALLMVDEAHSLGVIGESGRGIQEHFGLPADAIDIKMGTLSKSIASCGGFVAAKQEIIDFLKHSARGFIFSAALPAAQVAAARKCLEIISQEPQRSKKLRNHARRFVDSLRSLGFRIPPTESAIVPILFRDERATLEAVAFCRERGLFVVPVFYPAVPMDAPRIRATVISEFTESDLDSTIGVFRELANTFSENSQLGQIERQSASPSDPICRTRSTRLNSHNGWF